MMNERIRELAEQAGLNAPYGSDHEGLRDFDYRKFGELIVRECDRYVAEHYDEMEPWMEPGDLLKHFGVES
jgi:hypothetical protein